MSDIITIEKYPEGKDIGLLYMKDEGSRNTFTDEFVETFMERLKELQTNKRYKVIIIKGLPDVFCAGAAKEALMQLFEGEINVKDLVLSELLLQIPVPTIAAMEGAALGGGFVVAACADMIIMNEKKMYGTNFTNMGFTPGMGATRLVQAAVGDFIANEMLYRGRLFKGRTYRGRSLINYIVPKDEVMKKAEDIALDLDEKPRGTLETLKYSLSLKKRQTLLEARVHEDFMHKISFAQPEVQGMINELYGTMKDKK